jgi:hypothetical protein
MESRLVHANAVVVARQFNPTIFSQLWLVRNEIATEDDFQGESVFTPGFVQVRSQGYVLLVLPEQLQLSPLPTEGRHGELVSDKIGRIVRLLPETPYAAVGLNFNWQVDIDGADDFVAFSRALFFRNNPLYNQFDQADARFGGYLSKEMFGARLKLDMKPVAVGPPSERVERLLFAFNVHKDVERDTSVEEIEQMVGSWNDALDQTSAIVASLEGWQWR